MIPGERQQNHGRSEDLTPLVEPKPEPTAHSRKVRERYEAAARQRLRLLNTMSQAFASTMRTTMSERERFREERERLLEREQAARAEAEASRKQLRNVLESIGDAFSTLDVQWRYTYVNNRMVELVGKPQSKLLGSTVWEVFPELAEEIARPELLRAAEGAVTQFEHYSPRLRRWLRHRVCPSPAGLSVYTTDITEHKKVEEERERFLTREWMARAGAEERKRISRELHDRVAHSMGVVHQSLELYEALKESDPSQAEAKMKLAKETAREALDLTRNLAKELRSSEVEGSLSSALSSLLKNAVPPDLEYDVFVEGDESLVPPGVREQMFQVLREGVRNAVSHADARCLSVGVKIGPEEVVGSVEDDGRGFAETSGTSSGIHSMRERAELLGGAFLLSSAPDAGTRIKVSVPLKTNPAEGKAKLSKEG